MNIQMGSSYKKAIVSKNVERVLKQWHKDAKQRLKVSAANAAESSDVPSSSSLILHFKSKLRPSVQRTMDARRSQSIESASARMSSPAADHVRMEEGSQIDRFNFTN